MAERSRSHAAREWQPHAGTANKSLIHALYTRQARQVFSKLQIRNNAMEFANKHVVVTGAANGIGRCIAEAFLREGALVTVIDEDKIAGEKLQDVRFFHGDITKKSVLEEFVRSLAQPVDFLINNACVGRKGLFSNCSYEDFEYVQKVGVTAPYYLTSLLLQNNLLASNAAIVNIASTRAFQSQQDTESYSAAKGGIVALTHAMAISLARRARVNCISPGWIDTTESPKHSEPDKYQHPAGHVGVPADIAEMVLYLCSDKAGFITGENIVIDGGMSKLMVYHADHGWSFSAE
ncbi:MAG: SDR family oxidoreductase [Fibromonadales bacterium]|nr:SDR family oxidoreductase [Fibromonadales bacterium]